MHQDGIGFLSYITDGTIQRRSGCGTGVTTITAVGITNYPYTNPTISDDVVDHQDFGGNTGNSTCPFQSIDSPVGQRIEQERYRITYNESFAVMNKNARIRHVRNMAVGNGHGLS